MIKEDFEKAQYFVDVDAKYLNCEDYLSYSKDNPTEKVRLNDIYDLAELLQKEVHNAEINAWIIFDKGLDKSWFDKVLDYFYSLKLNFDKPSVSVNKISDNSSVKINIK
jgi:hypothetical protein